MFHHLVQLLSQLCQFPISPGRTRQRVEQPKSKSTQPRFASRWVPRPGLYKATHNFKSAKTCFRPELSTRKYILRISSNQLKYRSCDALLTFAALPLEVLAHDGTLRQQVAVPAAGPHRRRQAEVGSACFGAGGLKTTRIVSENKAKIQEGGIHI